MLRIKKRIRDRLTYVIIMAGFGLWGFASALMRPMTHCIGRIFDVKSATSGEEVMMRILYGTFICMSFVAALTIRRHGFKASLVMGLALLGAGSMAFYPATQMDVFNPFLVCYVIISAGFLYIEMTTVPYTMTYGQKRHTMFRLLMGYSINVCAWLAGFFLTSNYINYNRGEAAQQAGQELILDKVATLLARREDLWAVTMPYLWMGVVAIALAFTLGYTSFRDRPTNETARDPGLGNIFRKLLTDRIFIYGTACQFGYMMAQTIVWSCIMTSAAQVILSQGHGISRTEAYQKATLVMVIGIGAFALCRVIAMIWAWKKRIKPARALLIFAAVAAVQTLMAIFLDGYAGLIFLVGVSACMSIMQPSLFYVSMRRFDVATIQVGISIQVLGILGGLLARLAAPDGDGSVIGSLIVAAVLFGGISAYGVLCDKSVAEKTDTQATE